MPCLVWDSPQGRQVFELDRATLILGRDEIADVQLPERSVSRRHALLQMEGGTVRVTDLGSRSGTRINGAKLTPDMPSSLDPGDFVQLGRVTLTYHAQPPPQPRAAPPRAETPPGATSPSGAGQRRPARAAGTAAPRGAAPHTPRPNLLPKRAVDARWMILALILAFLLVAALGAGIAVWILRDDEPAGKEARADASGRPAGEGSTPDGSSAGTPARNASEETAPNREETPPSPPEESAPPGPEIAPAGSLPPQGYLSPAEFPDLLEVEYESYYPVRIENSAGPRVEAIGGDGRMYHVPRSKVTKAEDRVDLARRAARQRAQLDPQDAGAHLELARWCANHFIRSETRSLAQRVLELRPGDEEAARLLASTE